MHAVGFEPTSTPVQQNLSLPPQTTRANVLLVIPLSGTIKKICWYGNKRKNRKINRMSSNAISIDTQHGDMIVCSIFKDNLTQHDVQLDYYGKMLATCSSDNTIRIYSIEDGGAELITEINEYQFILYFKNCINFFMS